MRSRILQVVLIVGWVALAAETGFSCSVGVVSGPLPNTLEWTKLMVDRANVILRVTAVDYAVPPQGTSRTTVVFEPQVRFTVTEVVKGTYTEANLTFPGNLTEVDEWNPGSSPYTGPRATASGACYSNSYRKGGQFLLMLVGSTGGYSPNVLPLSPSNEQLHSAEDPWLLWVREEVKRK